MNRIASILFLAFSTAVFSVGAFAASKSTTLSVTHPTQVNGTTLKPGEYKVELKNAGQAAAGQKAEVTFKLAGQQATTVTGQVKQLSQAPLNTEFTVDDKGGVPTISEIDFGGSTVGIAFSSPTEQAGQ